MDGEYVCVVTDSLVARWRLFKGRELSGEDLEELRAAAAAEQALADAYRLLGHRSRSREELRSRLLAKDHETSAVEGALERLDAEGLIDDAAFARSYTADKRRLNGWGDERIRRGLRQLGVSTDDVVEALGDQAQSDVERALAVLRRGGAPTTPLDAARRRAFQLLRRRGFSAAGAAAAVRLWMKDAAPPPN